MESTVELALALGPAVILTRKILGDHEFHILGECDVRATLKTRWDEDIPPVTLLAAMHGPSASALASHEERTRHLAAYALSVFLSPGSRSISTRVEVVVPRKAKETGETGVHVVAAVRRAVKASLRELGRWGGPNSTIQTGLNSQ